MSIADKLTTIAENVQKVYDAGKAAGGGGDGYDEGFADGKQSERDSFWDTFQSNGSRKDYQRAFIGTWWNDTTYNPKYPIACSGDLTYSNSMFDTARITDTKVPITITDGYADNTFVRCTQLVTIQKLILNNVGRFQSTFTGCSKLENITIEGSIDVNFNISATAVLSNESVQSIIDHLKDLTGGTTQTVTFHTDVKMTTNQINAAKGKNWTVVGGTEVANDYFDG